MTFIYWVLFSFFLSLGYGEFIPPFISAWAANILFFLSGMIPLLIRSRT